MILGSRRRHSWLVTWAVVALIWNIRRPTQCGRQAVSSCGLPQSANAEGRYDIRRGAAGYAPIIGALGALAVPAIVVLFPVHGHVSAPLVTLAAGFLIVAMIASITGSIGLAGIGAEQDSTANLVPAAMYLAVAVSVSLVAMLAAFEVLAAIYLPGSKKLFAVIAGAAGLGGTFFTALGISDSWHTGPADPGEKGSWQKTQWFKSPEQADRKTVEGVVMSAVPAVSGIGLRIADVHYTPLTASVATWLVLGAFALAIGAVGRGMFRTRHPLNGIQQGLRRREAYGTTMVIGLYTLVIMFFLP